MQIDRLLKLIQIYYIYDDDSNYVFAKWELKEREI